MNKTNTVSSPEQITTLINFMESHTELANNRINCANSKIVADKLWSQLTAKLNAMGVSNRNSDGWKKVWTDIKYKIRMKFRKNIVSRNRTGGGPCKIIKLTDQEERVTRIASLDLTTMPKGKDFGHNTTVTATTSEEVVSAVLEHQPQSSSIGDFSSIVPLGSDFLSSSSLEQPSTSDLSLQDTALAPQMSQVNSPQAVATRRRRVNLRLDHLSETKKQSETLANILIVQQETLQQIKDLNSVQTERLKIEKENLTNNIIIRQYLCDLARKAK